MRHTLICRNGGLVIACPNDVRDNIIYLSRQAFSTNCVNGEPLIHLVIHIYEEDVRHGGSIPKTWGDMSIWGLLENQTEAIIDVMFGDENVDTWNPEGMYKMLDRWEKINRDKHGNN